MSSRTPSQVGRANLAKSKRDEAAVAAYLRDTGLYPRAERAVRTGFRSPTREGADPGDIANTPGLIVSVKSWTDPVLVDRSVPGWLDELDRMESMDPDPVRLLVVRRYGKADVGLWWAHMRIKALLMLCAPCAHGVHTIEEPARLLFRDAVTMMIECGSRRAA